MNNSLIILGVAAVIVQFVTEQLKKLITEAYRSEWTQILAAIIGIIVAFTTKAGIFSVFGIEMTYPAADYVLTGIAFSAGSSAFNELIKLISEMRPSNKLNIGE